MIYNKFIFKTIMNNKKIINEKYNQRYNNEETSTNEFKSTNKNKQIFIILNNKSIIINKAQGKIKAKKNKLLKVSKEGELRKIKKKQANNRDKSKRQNKYPNHFTKGNVYCFLYINNYPHLTLGPQFYYPILLFLFNNIIFFIFFKFTHVDINSIFKILNISALIIVNFSQLYTVLINQGIPKKSWFLDTKIINIITNEEKFYKEFNTNRYQICRKCNLLIDKFLKIIHCDICNVCCEFYDHHCPWVGKCIGKNNYISFRVFLVSNIIFIIIQIVILFIYIFN